MKLNVKLVYVKDGDVLKLAWSLAIDRIRLILITTISFVDANSGEVISKYQLYCKMYNSQREIC